MNLNPLYELKDRLESSIIAGVSLISDDFRLARAVEQMEPLSKASPVFGKIYQAAENLLSDACASKGDALLDLLGLVDAVLTTQAVSSIEGTLEPPAIKEGVTYSEAPYSQLAPILEALSSSGSGHYSLILDTHENHPELFSDYRLKAAMVAGLGAGYSELAEQIEKWLCEEDASILPLLKDGFTPVNKKEMVRRVHVIEAIAGAKENAWYLSMLDKAEKDVRSALIYALHHSPENRELLTSFVKTEKGNCKKAALWSLARMEGAENLEFWTQQLQKKPAESADYLALSTSDTISDLIAETINHLLDNLQEQAKEGNLLLSANDQAALQSLFLATTGKASPKMIEFYRRMAVSPWLDHMKAADNKPLRFSSHSSGRDSETLSFSRYVSQLLSESILWSMDERLFALAEELYRSHEESFLGAALTASLLTRDAACVYDTFSVRLVKEGFLKRETESQKCARWEIMNVFAKIICGKKDQNYRFLGCYYDGFLERHIQVQRPLCASPDPRWFELFTSSNLKKEGTFYTYQHDYYDHNRFYVRATKEWDDILAHLICPADKEICGILSHYFYQRVLANLSSRNCMKYFPLLNQCSYQGGQGLIVSCAEKERLYLSQLLNLIRMSPMPLSDKLAELEKLKVLTDNKKITVTGWNDDQYQNLHIELETALSAQQESVPAK